MSATSTVHVKSRRTEYTPALPTCCTVWVDLRM